MSRYIFFGLSVLAVAVSILAYYYSSFEGVAWAAAGAVLLVVAGFGLEMAQVRNSDLKEALRVARSLFSEIMINRKIIRNIRTTKSWMRVESYEELRYSGLLMLLPLEQRNNIVELYLDIDRIHGIIRPYKDFDDHPAQIGGDVPEDILSTEAIADIQYRMTRALKRINGYFPNVGTVDEAEGVGDRIA